MTRRAARGRLRPAALLALLTVVCGLWGAGCRHAEQPRSRSLLVIVVDTLRPDHLSLYGHPRPTTPRLDRRAERAVVFERAFSTSSWTLPAVASILTGRLPSGHGARSLGDGEDAERSLAEAIERGAKTFSPLDVATPTLASTLADAGYTTAAITSNPFLDPKFGLDRGFASYDQVPRRKADAVTDAALAWLREHHRGPFFLFVHFMDPHLPYRPPAELRGRFTAEIDSHGNYSAAGVRSLRKALPELSAAQRAFLEASYDEEILFVDRELERLLKGLDALGAGDSTLVMLTSDHGEEFFEHGGFEHGHSLYDEVLRVPLVVWETHAEAGRRELPVSLADLTPTALEALGVRSPTRLEGSSFWPQILDGNRRSDRRLIAAQGILHGGDQQAIIDWPHKLIHERELGVFELFDLATDPGERENLATEEPAAVDSLRRAARLLRETERSGEALELDATTLEELRALGYIQ